MAVIELRDKLNELIENEMVGSYDVMHFNIYRSMDDVSETDITIGDTYYGDYVEIK